MNTVVIAQKLKTEKTDLIVQFSDSFREMGLIDDFNQARAVFIKPNLTYPRYKEGVTTRVEYVEALVAALRQINTATKIYIGEGEGGYNSFSMTEAMSTMGFYQIAASFENVEIINLSHMPSRTVELEVNGTPYPLSLPAIFFDEIDFSITCPLPKVHCMTKITLAFKNQWGCVPDIMRLKNHFAFDQIIAQICHHLKFRYVFLDGKVGLDDNGPMAGIPKKVDWFVAANSLGAHDMIVSEMMGVDWQTVDHLAEANKRGFLPTRDNIKLLGDISLLKEKFILRRNFWNYPALIAFHSSWLTELVYLSRFSKIIHDIMYTFRKRPIN